MGKLIDLTGKRFGMLTVLSRLDRRYPRRWYWKCKCDCGNIVEVEGHSLRYGHTKSCGCYHRSEGKPRNRLYRCWQNMKSRCLNPNNKSYKHYGGRGIKVCSEWESDFWKFHDWALDNGYKDNLTIDRIDCNGDYTPNNCRWVTMFEQGLNKRNTCYIYYEGEKISLMRMAITLELDYYRIYDYLRSLKNGIEKSL